MRSFSTLVWLEGRRNWVWALSLLGSLLFWAWGLKQVRVPDVAGRLAIQSGLLVAAGTIGLLVLCLMVGRLRAETRNGQYQILRLSPPSGYTHVASRFTFAGGIAVLYFVTLAFLSWWIAEMAGVHFDPGTLVDLILATPVYTLTVVVLPLIAWTVFLMVFVSAYRLAGSGWIPGTVLILGTFVGVRWLWTGILSMMYRLPGWRLFADAPRAFAARSGSLDADVSAQLDHIRYEGVPLEPMLVMIALTVVLLLLAGRIWEEAEA